MGILSRNYRHAAFVEAQMKVRDKPYWVGLRNELDKVLSPEERRVLDLLIAGNSTPEIASIVGVNRSRVWRTLQKLSLTPHG
jgi:predicted transcriptional regulator